jgi:hypothetical protein
MSADLTCHKSVSMAGLVFGFDSCMRREKERCRLAELCARAGAIEIIDHALFGVPKLGPVARALFNCESMRAAARRSPRGPENRRRLLPMIGFLLCRSHAAHFASVPEPTSDENEYDLYSFVTFEWSARGSIKLCAENSAGIQIDRGRAASQPAGKNKQTETRTASTTKNNWRHCEQQPTRIEIQRRAGRRGRERAPLESILATVFHLSDRSQNIASGRGSAAAAAASWLLSAISMELDRAGQARCRQGGAVAALGRPAGR